MPGPAPHHGGDAVEIFSIESPREIRNLREQLKARKQEILEMYPHIRTADGIQILHGRYDENQLVLGILDELEKAERRKWQGQS